MKRRAFVWGALASVPAWSLRAGAQESFRFATAAAQGSMAFAEYDRWSQALRERIAGDLRLRVYPTGVLGDERETLESTHAGNLFGTTVGSTALPRLGGRPMFVFVGPGVVESPAQLERVFAAHAPELDTRARSVLRVLGWHDGGRRRLFSKTPIAQPTDLAGKKLWLPSEDALAYELVRATRAVPVELPVAAVEEALASGALDAIVATATQATRWGSHFRSTTSLPYAAAVGLSVVGRAAYEALAPERRTSLDDTARTALPRIRARARADDDRAFATLRRSAPEVDLTPHRAAWDAAARAMRERMVGTSRALLERVMATARAT